MSIKSEYNIISSEKSQNILAKGLDLVDISVQLGYVIKIIMNSTANPLTEIFTFQMHSSDWTVAFFLGELHTSNLNIEWYQSYTFIKEENNNSSAEYYLLRGLEFILLAISSQLKDFFKQKSDEIRVVFYKDLAVVWRNKWMEASLETVENMSLKNK